MSAPLPLPTEPRLEDEPPGWLAGPLRAVLAAILAYGVVGVVAAMTGWFRPLPVLLASAAGAAALIWASRRPDAAGARTGQSGHLVAAAVLVGASLVTAWNAGHHAQHLIIDRDPGVYATTARWLVDEGTLEIEGNWGGFEAPAPLHRSGIGFSSRADGDLSPQFPHLLPVVLAAAGWLDPSLILVANAAIGGLALLCAYAVARRLCGPLWAALAAGTLAIAFPFVLMARDTYSEPLAVTVLLGGLWVALGDRTRIGTAVLAGGLLGATTMVRIDGLVSLIPVAAVLGAMLRRSDGARGERRWAAAALGAAATTATIGLLDTWLHSRSYFESDLSGRLPALTAAAVGAGLAGFSFAPVIWPRHGGEPRLRRAPELVAGAVAAALGAIVLWLAVVRPASVGDLPETAGEATVPLITLADEAAPLTYRWLEWYLGPVATAVGFVGLIALLWAVIRRGLPKVALLVPGVALATTLLYLVAPNITPDQPWAIRRFTAVTIPGLLIATAWVADRLWRWRPPRAWWAGPAIAVALVPAVAVPMVQRTSPLRAVRPQVPSLAMVDDVCAIVDEEPSAVLIAPHGSFNLTLTRTINAWCGAPTAGATAEITWADIEEMARRWQSEGRRLLLISVPGGAIDGAEPPAGTIVEGAGFHAPEVTLTRPPERLVPDGRLPLAPGSRLSWQVSTVTPSEAAERAAQSLEAEPAS